MLLGEPICEEFLFSSFFQQSGGRYLINTWGWIHQWIISWALRHSSVTGTYLLTRHPSLIAPHWLGLLLLFSRAMHHFTHSIWRSTLHILLTCKIKYISFPCYFISWILILLVLSRRDNAREIYRTWFIGICVQVQLITSINEEGILKLR